MNATPAHCTMPITTPGMSHEHEADAGLRPACDLADTLERITEGLGRPPQILDLTGSSRARELFPAAAVFSPPSYGPRVRQDLLPYIDSSIDIVAVASPTPSLLAEARRVATLAIVECGREPQIEWLREPPAARLPSVSIIVPVFNQWQITKGCLQAIWSTVPRECEIEVIVSDDASSDHTPLELASLAASEPRLKVLRNENNSGFVESCNWAAAVATGDILVFLNNDTVPNPGWLTPLLRTFGLFSHVGAVGGKLLFPDGHLQEAGGIIFSDASAYHFGRGEPNAMAPLFDYVRQVDYVSGALMATPRDLFAALGGFDLAFAPGYYEDTDYCFRLRERGYAVYYQPEAVVVHLEGATAGTDLSAGMKRHQLINQDRFRKRHAAALAEQPARPETFDGGSWAALANRGKGRVRP
jgi:GT2 family glycosyltransferase